MNGVEKVGRHRTSMKKYVHVGSPMQNVTMGRCRAAAAVRRGDAVYRCGSRQAARTGVGDELREGKDVSARSLTGV